MKKTWTPLQPAFAAAVLAAAPAGAENGPLVIGPLTIGGAIRANYINGDYEEDGSDAPQRGGNGGNFELDTFRINLDYRHDRVLGKVEYRWYDGFNFLHTGWLGYDFEDGGRLEIGLNRTPFGVGPYGPSNNWFFDQHYYVGLSDDMDYGIKYVKEFRDRGLTLDLAYYLSAENSFNGASEESARYSYDIVDNGAPFGRYQERNQVNVRVVRRVLADGSFPTDLGVSGQWGELKADERFAEDAHAFAGSVHSITTWGRAALMLQLTGYEYDADYRATVDEEGRVVAPTNDLITMGAYDFAWPVASAGMIPAAAVSYTLEPDIAWIDSITFYNDYSVILKDGEFADGTSFNDSTLNVTGLAIARGGWTIYVDYAVSDGNLFVGNEGDVFGETYRESSVGDFGANLNNQWNARFNINFGYYF